MTGTFPFGFLAVEIERSRLEVTIRKVVFIQFLSTSEVRISAVEGKRNPSFDLNVRKLDLGNGPQDLPYVDRVSTTPDGDRNDSRSRSSGAH